MRRRVMVVRISSVKGEFMRGSMEFEAETTGCEVMEEARAGKRAVASFF